MEQLREQIGDNAIVELILDDVRSIRLTRYDFMPDGLRLSIFDKSFKPKECMELMLCIRCVKGVFYAKCDQFLVTENKFMTVCELQNLTIHKIEQRAYKRVAYEAPVELCLQDKTLPAQLQNVSLGGIKLRLNKPEIMPETLKVEFQVKQERFSFLARVVHQVFDDEGITIGLRFINMNLWEERRLSRLLMQLQSEELKAQRQTQFYAY